MLELIGMIAHCILAVIVVVIVGFFIFCVCTDDKDHGKTGYGHIEIDESPVEVRMFEHWFSNELRHEYCGYESCKYGDSRTDELFKNKNYTLIDVKNGKLFFGMKNGNFKSLGAE